MSDTKTSIALYFYRLGDVGGGAEKMTCFLANALLEREFNVHVISWDEESARTFYALNERIKWHRLGQNIGVLGKIQRTRRLSRCLSRNNIRALVGMVMSGDKSVYAAARMANVKLIAAERNAPSMYHHRYGHIQRWTILNLLRLVDQIVVQMPEYRTGYPGSLQKKISAIANPVLAVRATAKPDVTHNGKFTLLAVSRLDNKQKRLDLLIGAFARIAHQYPDWTLKLVGDGPDKAQLEKLTRMRGITNRVIFEPTTSNISDKYLQAHLFAMPSLWEGFPNALAEAMSHGLPAIGFEQASGVSELISKGGGWLAAGLSDETDLAETLSHAMSSPKQRFTHGSHAATAMTEFEPDKQFDKWARLLNKIA